MPTSLPKDIELKELKPYSGALADLGGFDRRMNNLLHHTLLELWQNSSCYIRVPIYDREVYLDTKTLVHWKVSKP